MVEAAKSELKAWAKKNLKGLENCIIPSFTPDLTELDEEGIRWDVQQSIKHGFFSTLCAQEVDLSFEEAKRFVEIVADEGKGKIKVATTLYCNSFDQIIEMAQHAEKVGCTHALFWLPSNFLPNSEEELYEAGKKVIEASNLGIVLYTTHKLNYERFYASGFPLDVLNKWADLDNVIGLKVGSNDFAYIDACFRTCGDRVQVNTPLPGLAPAMHKAYGQQWAGAATYEVYQSPEHPYCVNFFNHVLAGEYEKANEEFNKFLPMTGIFESQMMPTIILSSYHWTLLKYYQWCVGGNGGMIRHPLRIFGHQLMAIKMSFSSIGIIPREPEEEFFAGRMNYAKMKK